ALNWLPPTGPRNALMLPTLPLPRNCIPPPPRKAEPPALKEGALRATPPGEPPRENPPPPEGVLWAKPPGEPPRETPPPPPPAPLCCALAEVMEAAAKITAAAVDNRTRC